MTKNAETGTDETTSLLDEIVAANENMVLEWRKLLRTARFFNSGEHTVVNRLYMAGVNVYVVAKHGPSLLRNVAKLQRQLWMIDSCIREIEKKQVTASPKDRGVYEQLLRQLRTASYTMRATMRQLLSF